MEIRLTNVARKQIGRLPDHIQCKFEYWKDLIIHMGLREARKYKGFHDEPLHGKRSGERSVRLSKSYRIIYREIRNEKHDILEILEVNKHEY
ncbi:MAG: hypothetical protein IPJ71_19300 [Bdellovibrionales bacterium]|nr:hypothetical protein [Bdellovibrionales bacterium]